MRLLDKLLLQWFYPDVSEFYQGAVPQETNMSGFIQ
jgi:hypothetical protein